MAYLPFKKLNYADAVRAWVRFTLEEITKDQLNAALAANPNAIVRTQAQADAGQALSLDLGGFLKS